MSQGKFNIARIQSPRGFALRNSKDPKNISKGIQGLKDHLPREFEIPKSHLLKGSSKFPRNFAAKET